MNVPRKKRETGALKEVWQAFNSLVDYASSLQISPASSRGVFVNRTPNGTLLMVPTGKQDVPAGKVVRMRVESVSNDYLTCTNLDDNSTVLVAKPYNLRRTGWHGTTVSYSLEAYPGAGASTVSVSYNYSTALYRVATIGSYTEHQVIRPHYRTGVSEIFAAQCEDSGVDEAPDWIDLNTDARAWTMVM